MSLLDKQQEFIDLFNDLGEWNDKFDYLIHLSDELQVMPANMVVPENKIQGCTSQTYFCCTYLNDLAHIYGQSNAAIPSGIITVVKELFQGATRTEIQQAVINFHTETQLLAHLTPARAGALEQMILRLS